MNLLSDGKLRHFIRNPDDEEEVVSAKHSSIDDADPMYYDHEPGQYCMDKAVSTLDDGTTEQAQFAMVCSLKKVTPWTDPDFLLRKIINPIFHGISMCILLVIAIIYFVLPTLR